VAEERKEMIKIPTNVMIVDDEKDFVSILSKRLEAMGERVSQAYTGKECLSLLEEKNIDVIILDILMPEMDGIETLKEIKKRNPLVEVILLTGHGSAETAVEGMKLGAFDYLLKPTDFEDLVEKLDGARKKKDDQQERIRKAEAKLLLRRGGNI